jgi:hypothetical protein
MEHSPLKELNSSSDALEISRLLWNKEPNTGIVPRASWTQSTSQILYFKTHFNIIFQLCLQISLFPSDLSDLRTTAISTYKLITPVLKYRSFWCSNASSKFETDTTPFFWIREVSFNGSKISSDYTDYLNVMQIPLGKASSRCEDTINVKLSEKRNDDMDYSSTWG